MGKVPASYLLPRKQKSFKQSKQIKPMKKNLTPQQNKFIDCYVSGQTATESYCQAYSTKGKNKKLIFYHASKLLDDENIKKEIEKRKDKTSSLLNYTAEESFKNIKEYQELAKQKGDITNALKAEEMKQKLAGINKDQANLNLGIVGDFKEFYAAICAKKDYGNTEKEKSLSKSGDLSISPKSEVIDNKQ